MFCLFVFFLSCFSMAEPLQQSGIILSGENRNDLLGLQSFDKSKPEREQFGVADANLLTLNLKNANAGSAKFEGSVDFWLFTGAYADYYRSIDSTSSPLIPQVSSVILTDVRKLYASLFLKYADISIGRQIISFGEGMVFSPVDVFSSVNILDLSLRRSGSDVARIRVPFNDLSGVDAIAKLTAKSSDAAAAVKAYTHIAGFDCAGVGMYQGAGNEAITGITFKGDVVAGVYGEFVEHWKQAGRQAFTGMLGADYSLENTWVFTGEYLYNEKSETGDTAPAPSLVQTTVSLLHHHYGFLMARYKVNDLMNFTASVIADVSGKSGVGVLQYYYNILQNANVVVYTQYYRSSSQGLLSLTSDQATYGLRVEVAF